MGSAPLIELLGNRRVTLEGSTGVLLYESENIKINTNRMVVS
ncbi:MAG: YabP/YqfC family sporulation protein, partial [Ruminococcus sp.]|nr:YabP/YqfC family sporulation protein [Ruminococcus sp.]